MFEHVNAFVYLQSELSTLEEIFTIFILDITKYPQKNLLVFWMKIIIIVF